MPGFHFAPHRIGQADFPHPALRVCSSLRFGLLAALARRYSAIGSCRTPAGVCSPIRALSMSFPPLPRIRTSARPSRRLPPLFAVFRVHRQQVHGTMEASDFSSPFRNRSTDGPCWRQFRSRSTSIATMSRPVPVERCSKSSGSRVFPGRLNPLTLMVKDGLKGERQAVEKAKVARQPCTYFSKVHSVVQLLRGCTSRPNHPRHKVLPWPKRIILLRCW